MNLEEITLELLRLPSSQRALLAEKLLASLEEDSHHDVESLWLAEAEKRFQEIQTGVVQGRPAEEVLREARTRLK